MGILESAELTGHLDTVLDQLADYIERDLDARRKVTSALMYPGIIFLLSIVTVIVLTGWVLPKFRTFFDSLHAKLPLPTRMLLAHRPLPHDVVVPVLLRRHLPWSAGAIIMIRTKSGRARLDALFLKLPLTGDLLAPRHPGAHLPDPRDP